MGNMEATTLDLIRENIAKAFMMNRIPITVVADIVGIHVDSVVDWCNMIESDVSGAFDKRIDELENELEKYYENLLECFANLAKDIDGINGSLGSHRSQINSLKDEIGTTKATTEAIGERLDNALIKKTESMDARLRAVEVDIDSVNKRVDSVEKEIGEIRFDIRTVNGRLYMLESKNHGIDESIEDALNRINARLDENEKALALLLHS